VTRTPVAASGGPTPGGLSRAPTPVPRGSAAGRWLVIGAAFFWGTSATLARTVFRDLHVPPLTVVELRLAIAGTALGLWLALRNPAALRVRREDWLYILVLSFFGVATVQASYYYSISVLGVGLAILIQYIAPTLIVLVDVVRGHPVHRLTIVAVLAALCGTALLVGNAGALARSATPMQWVIAFSSAVWFAFYVLFSKRGLDRYPPETVLFYSFAIAAAFWAIVTPPARILAAGYDTRTWLLFLCLGIFSTLVPFSLFYAGLKRMRPAEAGIIATLEPVIASVSAAVLLGEGLMPIQWLGAGLVLLAATAASREHMANVG
jgi:drug/metabolite transporter (DMT)-like permease